jgi:hypothetical protein
LNSQRTAREARSRRLAVPGFNFRDIRGGKDCVHSDGGDITITNPWVNFATIITGKNLIGGASENDVFNGENNWFLSSNNQPFLLVVSANYTTPKMNGDGMAMKVSRRSPAIGPPPPCSATGASCRSRLRVPSTISASCSAKARSTTVWRASRFTPRTSTASASTRLRRWLSFRTPGSSRGRQLGVSAARYADYSGARRPSENISFGRIFRLTESGRTQIQVRGEFTNMFNRWTWPAPTGTPNSPVQRAVPSDPNSAIISGYGFINLNGGAGAVPRSGQMVARFTF